MAYALPAARNDGHYDDAQLQEPLLSSPRESVPISSVSTGGRFLTASAKVLVQLPTGSVIVFQALCSSVTNQGECRHPSNWWLSITLVILLTLSCIFFSFTDSVVLDGKLYYGVALPGRLFVFNLSRQERKQLTNRHGDKLKELHLQTDDYLHAAFTAVVFLALVFNDIGIQNCFFPHAGFDVKQCLKNIPPLVAVVASLLLMVCQTRRNSVDFLSRIAVQAHPSDTHDARRREYDEEAAMTRGPQYGWSLEHYSSADYQNYLANQFGGFLRMTLQAMLQTGENKRTLVHDDLERFHRPRDDLLMLRRAPSEIPRVHSESDLQEKEKAQENN